MELFTTEVFDCLVSRVVEPTKITKEDLHNTGVIYVDGVASLASVSAQLSNLFSTLYIDEGKLAVTVSHLSFSFSLQADVSVGAQHVE